MLRLVVIIFSLVTSLSAEEGFFGKDYDMNIFNPRPSQEVTEHADDSKSEIKNAPIIDANPNSQILENTALDPQEQSLRKKVNWIGMIINAHNQTHFFSEIRSFLEFVKENDYDLGPVYAIGKEITSSEMNLISTRINARGGILNFDSEPPKQFPVSQSPAWIIGTNEGQVVLEGLVNFQKYFNAAGEIVVQ